MRRKQRWIARFVSFCIRILHDHGRRTIGGENHVSATPADQHSRIGVPTRIALAVDCLTAPNSPAPPNGHWYYRTDRAQERKCWHLQTDNDRSEQGAAQTAREAPAKPSRPVAADGSYAGPGFKDSVAQHGGAKISGEDVEKLYAQFLEWERRTKN